MGGDDRECWPVKLGRCPADDPQRWRIAVGRPRVDRDGVALEVRHQHLVVHGVEPETEGVIQLGQWAFDGSLRSHVAARGPAVDRERAFVRDQHLVVHRVHRETDGLSQPRGRSTDGSLRSHVAARGPAVDRERAGVFGGPRQSWCLRPRSPSLTVSTARPAGFSNPVAGPLMIRCGATLPLAVRP